MLKLLSKKLEHPLVANLITKVFSIGGRKKTLDDFILEIFRKECTGEILEIGSGTGQFSKHYLNYVASYTATDTSLTYLKHARNETNTIKYAVCNCTKLSFVSNHFDRVFALFMFHHLSDEMVQSTLEEANRCLRQHGKLVIVDPFIPENKADLIGWILAKVDRGRWIRQRSNFYNLLIESGLTVEAEIKVNGSWPYNIWTYILLN